MAATSALQRPDCRHIDRDGGASRAPAPRPFSERVVVAALVWFTTRPRRSAGRAHDDHHVRSDQIADAQGADRDVAITPDGSRVVYRGNNQLLVRALDQLEPTVLSGLGTPRGCSSHRTDSGSGFSTGSA